MFSVKVQVCLWKILIFLELINYQVVTILFNDFIVLKFSRDLLLMVIVVLSLSKGRIKINKLLGLILIFIGFIIIATFKTTGLGVALVFIRKYISPLLFIYSIYNVNKIDKNSFIDIIRYMLNLLSILCLWGIFQAYVLGPEFLIKIGYPTKFSYAYNDITLKDSFYFGNLGIQRVVSTVSNSNVFALILGTSLVVILMNYRDIIRCKLDVIKLVIIFIAYVLTFSRANFLAFAIILCMIIWKYIPKKHYVYITAIISIISVIFLYTIQDENGITHKIVKWVINSIQFKESSAAGRTGIWIDGYDAVVKNMSGYGFGMVGAFGQMHNPNNFYHCENSYLAISIDLGVLGLLSYLAIIIVIFMQTCKSKKKLCGAVILYCMITFMFSNHIYDKEAMMIIGLFLAVIMNYKQERGRNEVYNNSLHVQCF